MRMARQTPHPSASGAGLAPVVVQSRDSARQFFFAVWAKHRQARPLEPLERLVAEVIVLHPEYHALLDAGPQGRAVDYGNAAPEHNPFLHMGLHIALREQVAADRPAGIARLHGLAIANAEQGHAAEHRMLDCLAEELWRAQSAGRLPDEQAYLSALRGLR